MTVSEPVIEFLNLKDNAALSVAALLWPFGPEPDCMAAIGVSRSNCRAASGQGQEGTEAGDRHLPLLVLLAHQSECSA